MTGQTCVITGATSGLGRAVARALGRQGATVVLIGRNEAAGRAVAAEIGRQARGAAEFFQADISALTDVRAVATRILHAHPRIDVLINNAGARFDRYQESTDGIELTFATNHLGHFLLTELLLDSLERSERGRVLTIASAAHRAATGMERGWLMTRETYQRRQAYARSKLANILFAFELARRLRNRPVSSNAIDPGIVATQFARNNGWVAWGKHLISHVVRRQLMSAERAGEAVVFAAQAPAGAAVTGKLLFKGQVIEPSADAKDDALAKALWVESVRLADVMPVNCGAC